jgi:biopolymer transport protein ExbB
MSHVYQFLFVKGGPVMYPIVLGSIFALALFLERIWSLRRERVTPAAYRRRVRGLLRQGKVSEAEVLSQENPSSLAAIVSAALREVGQPLAIIKETVNEVGRREVGHMERFVELLGTVTGLIRAFQRVEALASKGGGVNPGALAAGIWEALITTAAGLVVAIPAYVGYRYLQARLSAIVIDMEEDSLELAEIISRVDPTAHGAAADQVANGGDDRRLSGAADVVKPNE